MATVARDPFDIAADIFDPPIDPYASDPAGWALNILGAHLWSRMREVAESVRDHPRTSVRSGHGLGKTAAAAIVALWFLDTHPNSRVVSTATKWSQVEKLLWHEINQFHARGSKRPQSENRPIWQPGVSMLKTKVELPDGRYGIGLSSKPENSESFAGHHAEHILVIYDEASGINAKIFEVGEGYMTTDGARALLIGNPTRPEGEFYASHHARRADYNAIHISALESPAITGEPVPDELRRKLTGQAWVDGRRRAWGEDSPLFQVRVLGQFPKQSSDSVIGLGDVEDAQDRDVDVPYPAAQDDVRVVCDVARFGDDETVIGTRHGNRIRIRRTYMGKATTETTGQIIEVARELQAESGARPIIIVDDDGVGGGVTDQLREKNMEVHAFQGGARALEARHYPNVRSEAWFRLARRLPELDLDDDEQLLADLTAPRYRLNSDGQRVVERKDETKKRLGRSPDRGDMVVMALTPTLQVVLPNPGSDRPSSEAPPGGAWDAPGPTGGSLTADLIDDPM
jgi:hypothetical protein